MIKKNIKNALYAEILETTEELMLDKEIKQEEIISLKRISNTIIPLLVKNGIEFYTKESEWKAAKELYLDINEKTYQISLNQIRSALEQDYKKILDKRFRKERNNNQIDINLAKKFNFKDYANHPYIIKTNDIAAEEKISNKENPIQTEIKTVKENEKRKNENPIKKENLKTDQGIIDLSQEMEDLLLDDNTLEKQKIKSTQPKTELKSEKSSLVTNKNSISQKPMGHIIKEENKQKTETHKDTKDYLDMDLLISGPDLKIDEILNNSNSKNLDITIENIIMDIYTVTFNQKDGSEKVYTIIIAPAESKEDQSDFCPTFSMVKTGKNSCTNASQNKNRSSYQISLDNEVFVIRGKWLQNDFYSYLYPQNINNSKVLIQKRQMKPTITKNIGHNMICMEDGIMIHVLPLSSRNVKEEKTGLLVCLEDSIEKKFITTSTDSDLMAKLEYKKTIYLVTAGWQNKVLKTNVDVQSK